VSTTTNEGGATRSAKRAAHKLVREVERRLEKQREALAPRDVERVEAAVAAVRGAVASGRGVDAATEDLRRRAEASLGLKTKGATREYTESLVVAVVIALFLRAFVVEAFKIPTGSMIPTLQVGDHIFVNKFIYGLRVPLSNRWFVEWGDPDRGDIIVFRFPKNQAQDFIKRVVGVPGDRIRVEGREVFVNDEALPRVPSAPVQYLEEGEGSSMLGVRRADAYIERPSTADIEYTVLYQEEDDVYRRDWPLGIDLPGLACDPPGAPEPRTCEVQEGYFFVMGDNRDNSEDSRAWGGVPRALVKGRAMFVWLSWGPRSGIRWSRFGRGVH
jgi:signal peptidase I